MERLAKASREDDRLFPDVLGTFHSWMKEARQTSDTTLKGFIGALKGLRAQDGKCVEAMATEEYLLLIKERQLKGNHHHRIPNAVQHFMDFWRARGKALWRSNGHCVRAGDARSSLPDAISSRSHAPTRPPPTSTSGQRVLSTSSKVATTAGSKRQASHLHSVEHAAETAARHAHDLQIERHIAKRPRFSSQPVLTDAMAFATKPIEHPSPWMSVANLCDFLDDVEEPVSSGSKSCNYAGASKPCSILDGTAAHKDSADAARPAKSNMENMMQSEIKKLIKQAEELQRKLDGVGDELEIKRSAKDAQVASLEDDRRVRVSAAEAVVGKLIGQITQAITEKGRAEAELLTIKEALKHRIDEVASARDAGTVQVCHSGAVRDWERLLARPAEIGELDTKIGKLSVSKGEAEAQLHAISEEFQHRVEGLEVVCEVKRLEAHQSDLQVELKRLQVTQAELAQCTRSKPSVGHGPS